MLPQMGSGPRVFVLWAQTSVWKHFAPEAAAVAKAAKRKQMQMGSLSLLSRTYTVDIFDLQLVQN